MVLALAMVLTPMVGIVPAGKGQTKRDFQIYLVGLTVLPPEKLKVAGNNEIIRDLSFVMMGGLSTVQIGGETIIAENLGYEGLLDLQQHLDENGEVIFSNIRVNEIYICMMEQNWEHFRGKGFG